MSIDYDLIFNSALKDLRQEGRYRIFNNITRKKGEFPKAVYNNQYGIKSDVTIWCSNDYLGMGQNPLVVDAFVNAVNLVGAGAGGTERPPCPQRFRPLRLPAEGARGAGR